MIRLVKRKDIIENKKTIESELVGFQRVFFNEDIYEWCETEEEKKEYIEKFDCLNGCQNELNRYNKVVGIEYADLQTFTAVLSERLIKLLKHCNCNEFVIVSHLKLDFFGDRDNKFQPLVKSYERLEKIVGDRNYNEAFQIHIDDLNCFIEILFWITRCDMSSAEYIFIFDVAESIQFQICKYGNIHLTEYGQESLTEDVLKELGWKIIEGREVDQFTSDNVIEGRSIKI